MIFHFFTGQNVSVHGAECYADCCCNNADDNGVLEGIQEVHGIKCGFVVLSVENFRQTKWVCHEIHRCFKTVQDNQEKWNDEQGRQ